MVKRPGEKSKEEIRLETERLLAEANVQINKLPYRAPHHLKSDCDRNRAKRTPSTFSPREEVEKLLSTPIEEQQRVGLPYWREPFTPPTRES
jgi:hypothetical protein